MTTDEPHGETTIHIRKLVESDNSEAVRNVFERYFGDVVEKAKKWTNRLGVADEEDVAINVFDSIFRGVSEGKHRFDSREEFEELLCRITYHKAIGLYQFLKRSKRTPSTKLNDGEILEQFPLNDDVAQQVAERFFLLGEDVQEIATELQLEQDEVENRLAVVRKWFRKYRYRPTRHLENDPQFEDECCDSPLNYLVFREVMDSFDETIRTTLLLKLEGYTHKEIAEKQDVTSRTIDRRLDFAKKRLVSLLQHPDDEED